MKDRQIFFTPEGEYRPRLKPLSKNQKSILSLLNAGLLQAGVADRLRVSRPYVNQIVKGLESLGLISRRKPTYFYDLSSEAKSLLAGTQALDQFTPIRAHHFKRKFKILSQNGDCSLDKRTGFSKSWNMRGGMRHKFWFPGGANIPSVTLDIHPKTIVAYVDKHQNIIARNEEEAKQIGWQAIYKARESFIKNQLLFGVVFEVDSAGVQIGPVHGALVVGETDPIFKEVMDNGGKAGYKDWKGDRSCSDGEIESETEENWTRAGRGIRIAEKLNDIIQPEMFRDLEKIGPLTSEVHAVMAHIQGGQPIQHQVNQLILMFGKVLENQNIILDALKLQK